MPKIRTYSQAEMERAIRAGKRGGAHAVRVGDVVFELSPGKIVDSRPLDAEAADLDRRMKEAFGT